ncbi:hypothetical protein CHUAL_001925 [Chamberlinius hualienensis]
MSFSNNSTVVTIDKLTGKIFNGPLHATSVVLIVTATVTINVLVAVSAKKDLLRSCASRALLELICLVDAFGAVWVLIFPFCVSVTSTGRWVLGETMCHIDAAANVFVWLQHFIFIVASKFESTYTSHFIKSSTTCNVSNIALRRVKIFAASATLLSFTLSTIVTASTGGHFHRVLLLCIPNVPTAFYVVVLVLYFTAVIATALGYLAVIFDAKHQQRKIYCLTSSSTTVTAICNVEMTKNDPYAQIIRSASASFCVTVASLLITLPTVTVLGLPQFENQIPFFVYYIFDVVFYSEFMLNPIMLLVINRKIRSDVKMILASKFNCWFRCKCR